MFRYALLALALSPVAFAADPVPVDGTAVKFPRSVAVQAGGKTVTANLTGVGLRTRFVVNVYAIGSYLQDGAAAKTAEDVAKADAVKMLYIVMERTVTGKEFLEAIRSAVVKGRDGNTFAAEFAQLSAVFADQIAAKGDHISIQYVPGTGLRVQVIGKADVTVKGTEFARAVWDIFLGPDPINERLKAGLVSMLPR